MEGQQLRDTEGHARKWGDRKHMPHIQAVSMSEDSMPKQKHCPSPTPEGHTAVSTRDIRNNLRPQNRRKARQCEKRDRPRHRWVLARSTKPVCSAHRDRPGLADRQAITQNDQKESLIAAPWPLHGTMSLQLRGLVRTENTVELEAKRLPGILPRGAHLKDQLHPPPHRCWKDRASTSAEQSRQRALAGLRRHGSPDVCGGPPCPAHLWAPT